MNFFFVILPQLQIYCIIFRARPAKRYLFFVKRIWQERIKWQSCDPILLDMFLGQSSCGYPELGKGFIEYNPTSHLI
jgi:hypothetical protein